MEWQNRKRNNYNYGPHSINWRVVAGKIGVGQSQDDVIYISIITMILLFSKYGIEMPIF